MDIIDHLNLKVLLLCWASFIQQPDSITGFNFTMTEMKYQASINW